MRRATTVAAATVTAGLWLVQPAGAQQPSEEEMMAAWQEAMAVGPEHEALAERAGRWQITTTYMPGEGEEIVEHGVADRVVTLDGRVLQEKVSGSMMGMEFTGEGRSGYDNVTDRYWTTWTDTTSTAIILLYGSYDEATKTYTFEGTVTDPLMGETPMRLQWTIDGPDRETAVFYAEYPEVGETEMMQMVYERQ